LETNKNNVDNVRINEHIMAHQVLLIGPTGTQAGVIETKLALKLAQEEGFDIVEVNPNSNPPVAKLMDYGKLKYEEEKARRKQAHKAAEVKEIRLSVNTSDYDMKRMANHAAEFLKAGHKVRITVMMKGRERSNPQIANDVTRKFVDMVGTGTMSNIKNSGKSVGTVLTPCSKTSKKQE
jgi:translation initiation factor IF-3